MSAVVVATGLIIFRRLAGSIQYLLLQTSYGIHHWTPPKGHVDPGEDEMQTALRETQEEAGLTESQFCILDGFQKTLNYEVHGKPKRVVYWLAELNDPNTPVIFSHEHQGFEWAELAKAKQLSGYEDLQQTLSEAEKFIKSKL